VLGRHSATSFHGFAEVVSFFLPPPLCQRYARLITDIGSLPGATLDDAFGLFVCQLWTTEPAIIATAAHWFGVPPEDVAKSRDHVLDDWNTWESVWDIDAHAQLIDSQDVTTPTPPALDANFTRMARQCRYAVWVPAFPDGSAYLTEIAARHTRGGDRRVPRYATALARQVIERLEELWLNASIAQDVGDLLRAFYRRHVPGRTRVNALAEEALGELEDALRDASSGDGEALWSRRFPDWVRSTALRVLLARSQPAEGVESPLAILDRLRPHLVDVVASVGLAMVDPADLGTGAARRSAGTSVRERKAKHAAATATKRIERRLFLPAGLKPVASYGDQTLTTAARHGRLAAAHFLRRWYTTDRAVADYLPKQEPRGIVKHGFRAVATLSPYGYFVAMNRFRHLLVRERNRVFIPEELWWRLKEGLDRPVSGPDILLRFATSHHDYHRLLTAAKAGRLEGVHDPHRRAWVTTREQVEAYRSIDRLMPRHGRDLLG
jgi:hypothetical protein